jgi:L-amino acid N-acyltransferase YncA
VTIRPATPEDADAIWRIFYAVVQGGDSYTFTPDTPRQQAVAYFLAPGITSWVVEDAGRIVGMYKLIPNHGGRGDHVANASFMVDPAAQARAPAAPWESIASIKRGKPATAPCSSTS